MPRQRFSGKVDLSFKPDLPALGLEGTLQHGLRPIDDLFSATYEELRRLASFVRRSHGHPGISPTTLVNEAWLKLANSQDLHFESPLHFKLTAARAMRQVLVEVARRQSAQKRGGDGEVLFVTFQDFSAPIACDRQLLALHESLDELARLNPRQAMLVESRYFGGMDIAETAALLDVSEATVQRDWRAAKAWLGAQIRRRA